MIDVFSMFKPYLACFSGFPKNRWEEIFIRIQKQWLVPNKLLVNPPAAKPRESNSRPRPRANPRRRLVASRSRTDTARVPSRWEKSASTKSPRNCSSESCRSKDWSEKSPKISRLTCDSNPPRSWPCKKRPKRTWLACSKTPTCARSTPRESPSCRRTSNWREESEANVRKESSLYVSFWNSKQKQTKWKVFFPPTSNST